LLNIYKYMEIKRKLIVDVLSESRKNL
jgi:hypothetical protein